jgi:hypothetical protein
MWLPDRYVLVGTKGELTGLAVPVGSRGVSVATDADVVRRTKCHV